LTPSAGGLSRRSLPARATLARLDVAWSYSDALVGELALVFDLCDQADALEAIVEGGVLALTVDPVYGRTGLFYLPVVEYRDVSCNASGGLEGEALPAARPGPTVAVARGARGAGATRVAANEAVTRGKVARVRAASLRAPDARGHCDHLS
jgi:hypothetical protein